MAEHAAIRLADHFRPFAAFGAIDGNGIGRHHACPKVHKQAGHHCDCADYEENSRDDLAGILTEQDDSACPEDHEAESDHRQQKSPGSKLIDFCRFKFHVMFNSFP